jgi:hypothetical protein
MSYRGRVFAEKWIEENTKGGLVAPSAEDIVSLTEALLIAASAEGILAEEIEAEISDLNGCVAAAYSARS